MTRRHAAAIQLGGLLLASVWASPAGGWPDGPPELESSCVSCHELEDDVELSRQVSEWRESVHAEHSVSCDACHGGDPRLADADDSMSDDAGFLDLPSWTELAAYCGVCHEEIAESYDRGPFGRAILRGTRVATCVTCHMQEGHRITTARPGQLLTTTSCPSCPSVGDPNGSVRILQRVREADAAVTQSVRAVEAKGIELTDFRRRLRGLRAEFGSAVHEFDADRLDAARSDALRQLQELALRVARLDREADRRRRLGIGLLAALALLLFALLGSLRNLD